MRMTYSPANPFGAKVDNDFPPGSAILADKLLQGDQSHVPRLHRSPGNGWRDLLPAHGLGVVVRHDDATYPPVSGLIVKVGQRKSYIKGAKISSLNNDEIRISSLKISLEDFQLCHNIAPKFRLVFSAFLANVIFRHQNPVILLFV